MERRDGCKDARFKGTAEGGSPGQDVASGCLMDKRATAMAMAAVDAAMGYCSGGRRRGRESGHAPVQDRCGARDENGPRDGREANARLGGTGACVSVAVIDRNKTTQRLCLGFLARRWLSSRQDAFVGCSKEKGPSIWAETHTAWAWQHCCQSQGRARDRDLSAQSRTGRHNLCVGGSS